MTRKERQISQVQKRINELQQQLNTLLGIRKRGLRAIGPTPAGARQQGEMRRRGRIFGCLDPKLAEHQNAEKTDVGASTYLNNTSYYDTVANLGTIISQTITTTKRCCIVVVTLYCSSSNNPAQSQIQRGGINRTVETTLSAVNFVIASVYAHLQYATEVLNPGTYTYSLINVGAAYWIYGSAMKIVAVSAT